MSFAAAAGSTAPTTIHTDTQGLSHGDFELAVPGGPVAAYYAAPAGREQLPIVLVVQEIFGLHEHIRMSAAAWRTMAIWRSRSTCTSARATPRATTTFPGWSPNW